MFVPPPIESSPAKTVKALTSEKHMKISEAYWEALSKGTDGAQFAKVDLLAANAVLMIKPAGLKEKLTEHAFTENHGGRWIRLVANENEGEHQKIMFRHAEDEERHGLLFLKLLRELGHDVNDDILGPEGHIAPYYMDLHKEYGDDLYNFMCFVHAAEVRTLIYIQQVLYITSAYTADSMKKINNTFAVLYHDELFHIRYTANIIGQMMDQGREPKRLIDAFAVVHDQTKNTVDTLIGNYKPREA